MIPKLQQNKNSIATNNTISSISWNMALSCTISSSVRFLVVLSVLWFAVFLPVVLLPAVLLFAVLFPVVLFVVFLFEEFLFEDEVLLPLEAAILSTPFTLIFNITLLPV